MAPHGKRTFGSGIAVGLVCALLVAMPRMAHAADLGDEPSKSSSSSSSSSQIEDTDRPKESILDKKPADAAVASKKAEPAGPPFYENWKFWAVAGGIVVGVIAVVIVSQKVAHQVSGGDVRPCNMDFLGRCFGENH